MQVCVVEDNSLTALFLQESLEDLGHQVVGVFDNGAELLEFTSKSSYDIVLMDINIRGPIDGIQLANKLQELHKIPAIYITSYQDSQMINDAMTAKPIAYLIKPIDEAELEATLAVAKNYILPETSVVNEIQCGAYTYIIESNTLLHDQDVVKLSQKEIGAISLLFKNAGNVVSTEMMLNTLWGDLDRENSLRELIYRLRKKLPELPITVLTSVGYSINRS